MQSNLCVYGRNLLTWREKAREDQGNRKKGAEKEKRRGAENGKEGREGQ